MELNEYQFGKAEPWRPKRWITEEVFNKTFTPERDKLGNYTEQEKEMAKDFLFNQPKIQDAVEKHADTYYSNRSSEADKEDAIQQSLKVLSPYGATRAHVMRLYEGAKQTWAERTMAADRRAENAAGVGAKRVDDWGRWWVGFDK